MKNDSGVVKQHANEQYEETFSLAIKHGKITEERKQEILAKISKVASNDPEAFNGTEKDIKVSKDFETGNIIIDMAAHCIQADPNDAERMNVCYAATKSAIKNASTEQ